MNKEHLWCAIEVADVQRVAQETVGRELTRTELEHLQAQINENLDWYGTISQAVQQLDDTSAN